MKNAIQFNPYLKDLINEKPLVISQLLLKYYSKIDIDEIELIVIIQLIRFKDCLDEDFPSFDKLEESMTLCSDQIRTTIARLIEKGLITVEHSSFDNKHGKSSYNFEHLWDRLLDVWQKSKAKENGQIDIKQSNKLKTIYNAFEKEFARYLSPIESSKIAQWCTTDGFSSELILEALERSVLQGALSFKYIDTILRSWANQNLKTIDEINLQEKKFQEKRRSRTPKFTNKLNQKSRDKYSEIYIT